MSQAGSADLDLLCIGRASLDLYSLDVGAPFTEITGFGAYVGGCPTNIAVGGRRLGLRTALLTALGADPVGDFVQAFLEREGVETAYIPRKPGHRTSAVVLGIQPPDRFPLVFYRDNCADIELDVDDVLAAPVERSRMVLLSGTGLSAEPSRSATLLAAERAHEAGATVVLDLDLRADLWHDSRAFGVNVRRLLPLVDVAIGTEEEVRAAAGTPRVARGHDAVVAPQVEGDTETAVRRLLAGGLSALVVKRGIRGASVYTTDGGVVDAAPFPVEVLNVLGAGDAFASGFLYGVLHGWDWQRAARMGNATGAIVVTRPACANDMPTLAEAEAFVAERGGL